MTGRFECRFAVGTNGCAYSSTWLVFTARKQPDLYIAVKSLSGLIKATVHCPRPPNHPDYGRHFGFVNEASGAIAAAVKADGDGRHVLRWTGYQLGSALPMPAEHECVDVGVLLGEPASLYPKEIGGETHLLDEGRLSDGRRVWIIYCVYPIREPREPLPPSTPITPEKSYLDPDARLSSNARAILFGAQQDGSLGFMDCRVDAVNEAG
jgi:hypothetical protein